MASLNKVMLIGNVTRDPEIRYTPKGTALMELGMAMNRRYRLETGEEREEVTFVDVTFWGKQAETLGKWVKKGNPIYVEGRLQLDSWDDKNTGKKVWKLRVVGDNFQFLGGKPQGSGGPEGSGGYVEEGGGQRSFGNQSRGMAQQKQEGDFPPGLDDDEIPF